MSAAPITYTMPDAKPSLPQRLAALNARISQTRARIGIERTRLADLRMQLNVQCNRRSQLLAQRDQQFLDTITDQTLEAALSKPGPLVEKLATAMHIVAEEEGEAEQGGAEPSSGLPDPTEGDGDHLPTLEPDPEFADLIEREAQAELNAAIAQDGQSRRSAAEEEAMEALNGDDACDSNGEA